MDEHVLRQFESEKHIAWVCRCGPDLSDGSVLDCGLARQHEHTEGVSTDSIHIPHQCVYPCNQNPPGKPPVDRAFGVTDTYPAFTRFRMHFSCCCIFRLYPKDRNKSKTLRSLTQKYTIERLAVQTNGKTVVGYD